MCIFMEKTMTHAKTCNPETCEACNDPTDMPLRRAIGKLEEYLHGKGFKGSYADKAETVRAIAAELAA